jgi:hypothetical protein
MSWVITRIARSSARLIRLYHSAAVALFATQQAKARVLRSPVITTYLRATRCFGMANRSRSSISMRLLRVHARLTSDMPLGFGSMLVRNTTQRTSSWGVNYLPIRRWPDDIWSIVSAS